MFEIKDLINLGKEFAESERTIDQKTLDAVEGNFIKHLFKEIRQRVDVILNDSWVG